MHTWDMHHAHLSEEIDFYLEYILVYCVECLPNWACHAINGDDNRLPGSMCCDCYADSAQLCILNVVAQCYHGEDLGVVHVYVRTEYSTVVITDMSN